MAEEKKNYVNFNGIPKEFVHERTGQDGNKFYSVGITPVPYTFSRSGIANITTNYAKPTKNDPNKFNVGFPEDFKLKVSVASFYDKDDASKNKYKEVEMTAKELQAKQIEARKAIKDAKANEAPEEEAEGPELD